MQPDRPLKAMQFHPVIYIAHQTKPVAAMIFPAPATLPDCCGIGVPRISKHRQRAYTLPRNV
ncbi:MAG: hypothetical protein ACRETL_04560 [Gammaproteobacteria bacterium]